MKRLFTLVCLFAVFSMAFASNGSFSCSGKDVKQENVVKFTAQKDFQLVQISETSTHVVASFVNFKSEIFNLKTTAKTKKDFALPDIVQSENYLYNKILSKSENQFNCAKDINKNSYHKRNYNSWRSREILKC